MMQAHEVVGAGGGEPWVLRVVVCLAFVCGTLISVRYSRKV